MPLHQLALRLVRATQIHFLHFQNTSEPKVQYHCPPAPQLQNLKGAHQLIISPRHLQIFFLHPSKHHLDRRHRSKKMLPRRLRQQLVPLQYHHYPYLRNALRTFQTTSRPVAIRKNRLRLSLSLEEKGIARHFLRHLLGSPVYLIVFLIDLYRQHHLCHHR